MINDIYLVDKYNYPGVYHDNGLYGLIDETTLDTIDMIVIDRMKYDYYTKQWSVYKQESFTTFSGERFNYDSELDVITYLDNQTDDTLELVTVYPNDLIVASPVQYSFYWKSYQTQISSGDEISPDGTFSNNNYYNDYNNKIDNETQNTDTDKIIANQNQNTQDIINTLDNPEVDDEYLGEFNGYFSGDSAAISRKFGFLTFPTDVYNDIYLFLNDLISAIIDDNDVYFDFSLHGETPTRIYSSDIYVPNGVLKSFISVFLVACTVYVIYLKFFNYYELLCSGNISTLINDFDIDKSIFRM